MFGELQPFKMIFNYPCVQVAMFWKLEWNRKSERHLFYYICLYCSPFTENKTLDIEAELFDSVEIFFFFFLFRSHSHAFMVFSFRATTSIVAGYNY